MKYYKKSVTALPLWYRCVRIVFTKSVSLWHTDPWNPVLSEFTKSSIIKSLFFWNLAPCNWVTGA